MSSVLLDASSSEVDNVFFPSTSNNLINAYSQLDLDPGNEALL